ncbi:MAG: hypothetical protein HOP15_12635 [Planctomycetes bacterium]|nr:hypothetical protein [Planctomycetota bacterium]
MKPSYRFSLTTILLGAVLVGRGLATETGQPGQPLSQIYPGPLGYANFGKIVSGEFTGDLKRDAVLMDGTRPVLVVAPETFESAITVRPIADPTANDIAVLGGALADPDKDCILTVSSAGLERYERDSAAGTWNVVTIRGSTTSWNNARLVAVGQVDGVGRPDIVGIAADGRTVMIEYGNVDGTYTAGPVFQALATDITDIWLLNWRETSLAGACEIALNCPLGLVVHNRNGLALDGFAWSQAPMYGAVITYAGTLVQRLGLVSESGGQDGLMVYGDTVTEPNLWLGALGVVSVASGDADGDGNSELFLSVTSQNAFKKLENLAPASPSFDAAHMTGFPYGSGRNPAANHAGLAPGDFDSDGKLDVLAPAQGSPNIGVYGSVELVNVESQVVAGWRASMNQVTYIISSNSVRFRFTRPMTVLDPGNTTLGIQIYRTPQLGAGTLRIPYFRDSIPMPDPDGLQFNSIIVPMPAGFSLATSTDLFSFVVRQAQRNPTTGAVLDIAPAMTAIFTPDPNVDTIFQLPKTLLVVPAMTDPSSSPSWGGISIGPTVPHMDEEVEPEDNDDP